MYFYVSLGCNVTYTSVWGAGQMADGKQRLWRETENIERRSINLKNFASHFSQGC